MALFFVYDDSFNPLIYGDIIEMFTFTLTLTDTRELDHTFVVIIRMWE